MDLLYYTRTSDERLKQLIEGSELTAVTTEHSCVFRGTAWHSDAHTGNLWRGTGQEGVNGERQEAGGRGGDARQGGTHPTCYKYCAAKYSQTQTWRDGRENSRYYSTPSLHG